MTEKAVPSEDRAAVAPPRADDRQRDRRGGGGDRGEADAVEVEPAADVHLVVRA